MATYFVIENDTITNRIVYREGDEYDPGEDAILRLSSRMPSHIDIGWRKISNEWVTPPEPQPIEENHVGS